MQSLDKNACISNAQSYGMWIGIKLFCWFGYILNINAIKHQMNSLHCPYSAPVVLYEECQITLMRCSKYMSHLIHMLFHKILFLIWNSRCIRKSESSSLTLELTNQSWPKSDCHMNGAMYSGIIGTWTLKISLIILVSYFTRIISQRIQCRCVKLWM